MNVGFTAGTFDLLHVGHLAMLEEAKAMCDYLIVGLQIDPTIDRPKKNKPTQSLIERQLQLRACKFVDEVIVYETEADLINLLAVLNIDVRIIGADWQGKRITGRKICQDKGIQIYYNYREHDFSSSELKERIKNG